jgi:hypothetical protein
MPRWVEEHVRETGASVAFRGSDMAMQLTAIRAGAGREILPSSGLRRASPAC